MAFVLPSVKCECKGYVPLIPYPWWQVYSLVVEHFAVGMVLTFINTCFR
jgi:hypothetical protein